MSAKIEQLVAMRLNSYFKDQPNTPALTELKDELSADLNEAAEDKLRAGQEPESAVAEAFSDFGDINALIRQINAENGTDKVVHGHHVVMDDNGLFVDDGETLKIDADGLSINNGTIKADRHGLKLGSWTFDDRGINLNDDAQADFKAAAEPAPVDLTGEYHENLPLVNEQRFNAAALTHLVIDYQAAQVKILPTTGADDEVIVREYMNHNNPAYQAKTRVDGQALRIVQGKVPFLIPLRVHVQIHVPANYAGDLTLDSRSGTALLAGLTKLQQVTVKVVSGTARLRDLKLSALSSEVTSGSCELTRVAVANQLGMLVKSGRCRLQQVTADRFTVNAVSGTIIGEQLAGGGDWSVKSGTLRLAFARVAGDTNLEAQSGTIKVAVPADASYHYELEAHSGRVVAPERGAITHSADGYRAGQVGTTGAYLIQGQTTSGTIRLS